MQKECIGSISIDKCNYNCQSKENFSGSTVIFKDNEKGWDRWGQTGQERKGEA